MLTANKEREIVLDTSAFIAGYEPLSIESQQYSVPKVRCELVPNTIPWTRFNAAVEDGKLKVREPRPEYVEKIKTLSKTVGDLLFLSQADQQVLALALELKETGHHPQVVTDDYSIQNVANEMGIEFTSMMTLGIRYRFCWMLYCPACYKRYPADHQPQHCETCGTKLRRKPTRKTPV